MELEAPWLIIKKTTHAVAYFITVSGPEISLHLVVVEYVNQANITNEQAHRNHGIQELQHGVGEVWQTVLVELVRSKQEARCQFQRNANWNGLN